MSQWSNIKDGYVPVEFLGTAVKDLQKLEARIKELEPLEARVKELEQAQPVAMAIAAVGRDTQPPQPKPTPAAAELEALRGKYEELQAAYAKLSTQLTRLGLDPSRPDFEDKMKLIQKVVATGCASPGGLVAYLARDKARNAVDLRQQKAIYDLAVTNNVLTGSLNEKDVVFVKWNDKMCGFACVDKFNQKCPMDLSLLSCYPKGDLDAWHIPVAPQYEITLVTPLNYYELLQRVFNAKNLRQLFVDAHSRPSKRMAEAWSPDAQAEHLHAQHVTEYEQAFRQRVWDDTDVDINSRIQCQTWKKHNSAYVHRALYTAGVFTSMVQTEVDWNLSDDTSVETRQKRPRDNGEASTATGAGQA
jgi:hypothetical protein